METTSGTTAKSSRSTPSAGRIDPQAQAIVDAFAKRPKLDASLDDAGYVAAVRAGYRAFSTNDDGPAGPPEPVAIAEDTSIAGPNGTLPARIYRSRENKGGPLVVWFHGGGFIAGDLDTHDRPLRALVNRCSCTLLSVAWRLAPEHPFPAAIEDAHTATLWAAAHAKQLDTDPKRLIVAGDSAGGAGATIATMLARERGGPEIAMQVLVYPSADMRAGYTYPSWKQHDRIILDRSEVDRWFSMYLPPEVDRSDPHVSPALASAADLHCLPPAVVITGEFDPLRDEGETYAARLEEAGVAVSLSRYPGMIHGFFQMAGKLDAGKRVIEQIAKAIDGAEQ